jgi:2-oxoglutarate ferredoxin oxidoreductase subunit alpha
MDEVSIFLGGQAGEGVKRGANVIGKVLNLFGHYIFIMDDYISTIRGGQDYSEIRTSVREIYSQSGKMDIVISFHRDIYDRYKDKAKENSLIILDGENAFNIPFEKIIKEQGALPVMKPSIALGILSFVLGIPLELVKQVLDREFKEKSEKNIMLAEIGFSEAKNKNFPQLNIERGTKPPLPIVSGNELTALGAARAGMKVYTAYPITPASTVLHFLAKEAKRLGIAALHTEDEISAAVMAIGAAYAGAPAMCGTSGPGIDLMGEAISLAGGTEVPLVILDAQRAGPTTGVPTYTEQGDLNLVLNVGHGEFPRIVLAPGTIDESFEVAARAIQYAWWYQTPVFVLTDKHIAESSKTADVPFKEDYKLPIKYFEGEEGEFKRYKVTEDGISPIAFPGMKGIVNHTNSTEHTEEGYSSSLPENVIKMKNKRLKKIETIENDFIKEHTINVFGKQDSKNLIISFGSPTGAILEAINNLPVKFLQVISLEPFPKIKVKNVLHDVENVISVEQNSTAQFANLFECKMQHKVNHKILRYDGRPFDPFKLRRQIEEVLL